MIYYFSGTGNSKWVAEQLAKLTDDRALNIAPLMKEGFSAANVEGSDRLGLVFPIHAWAPPRIMLDFARGLRVESGAYVFAVCTCGDDIGNAMQKLQRHVPLGGAWSVAMPNNYLMMGSDVDTPETERSKIEAARERLPHIAAAIQERKRVTDVVRGKGAWLKTGVICPLFNAFAMRTKPFAVNDDCIGCGLCEKNCPVDAIKLSGGKPMWTATHCLQCASCINRCPQKAIQYGKQTVACGRYYCKEN